MQTRAWRKGGEHREERGVGERPRTLWGVGGEREGQALSRPAAGPRGGASVCPPAPAPGQTGGGGLGLGAPSAPRALGHRVRKLHRTQLRAESPSSWSPPPPPGSPGSPLQLRRKLPEALFPPHPHPAPLSSLFPLRDRPLCRVGGGCGQQQPGARTTPLDPGHSPPE